MFEFILERYNYWIVITLMMIGLYIVFSRGNLVKTIIGLNVFQTSVFVFYITIGKVAGATAPVLIKTKSDKAYDGGHGGDYGKDHGAVAHAEPAMDAGNELPVNEPAATGETNTLADALEATGDAAAAQGAEGLHSLPDEGQGTNDLFGTTGGADMVDQAEGLHQVPETVGGEVETAQELAHTAPVEPYGADVTPSFILENGDILYTNPLPHVLILTAIVVGVATTAVGLALSVRIREAYGTIEEDELEAADHLAQFGRPIATASQEGSTR